ncbi:MAG: T9SS type A sorting domain-containing protein [Cyclobacteriaceae bacterium]|nr:T9SS type A sorting domain-containing protein [Cyclobacteriaceae bacterium]
MKRTMTFPIMLILVALGLFSFNSGKESGKVHLKVTKNDGGKTTVLQKSYESMDALKSDDELKKFDVLLEEWANDAGGEKVFSFNNTDTRDNVVSMKKPGGESMTWVNENGDTVRTEKEIIIKHKDGKEEKVITEQKKVMVFSGEGQKEMIIEMDSDGTDAKTWTDEKGNVMKLNENSGDRKVIVIVDDKDTAEEIEVNVETNEERSGDQKTITKKVWVTEDGKKMELEGDDMEIITKGGTFNIKLDRMENDEFAMGDFKGDKVMIMKNRGDDSPGETIDVDIENKNGEQFIEINIKRAASISVTISDIEPNDAALKGATVSLKSNLKSSSISYDPNPGTGKFTLKFALDQKEPVSVKVLDILGNEVYSETVMDFQGNYDNQIDLKGKSKGIYILQIGQNKKTLARKIVIE